MAEAVRPRPVEYYNPRPLILGVCFFWGVAMGFGLNFFRTPEDAAGPAAKPPEEVATESRSVMSESERRQQGAPNITEVAPAPSAPASFKPSLETMELAPPTPALTTDAGLTGRTATPVGSQAARPLRPANLRPAAPASPPPIPELGP